MFEAIHIDEYPLASQLYYSGAIGYVVLLLFALSVALLLASWLNYMKFRKRSISKLIRTLSVPILCMCIFASYIHVKNQETVAENLINTTGEYSISSDLALRGFYITKLIPRYGSLIAIIVVFSMIPSALLERVTKGKTSDNES